MKGTINHTVSTIVISDQSNITLFENQTILLLWTKLRNINLVDTSLKIKCFVTPSIWGCMVSYTNRWWYDEVGLYFVVSQITLSLSTLSSFNLESVVQLEKRCLGDMNSSATCHMVHNVYCIPNLLILKLLIYQKLSANMVYEKIQPMRKR